MVESIGNPAPSINKLTDPQRWSQVAASESCPRHLSALKFNRISQVQGFMYSPSLNESSAVDHHIVAIERVCRMWGYPQLGLAPVHAPPTCRVSRKAWPCKDPVDGFTFAPLRSIAADHLFFCLYTCHLLVELRAQP